MKKILVLVIIIIAVVAGAQFYLPSFVSKQVSNQFQSTLQPKSQSVVINSSPAIAMVGGTVDSFNASFTDVALGDLNVHTIHMNLHNLQISPSALLFKQKVDIQSIGQGEIDGAITQEDLQHFLEKKVNGLKITAVRVTDKGVELQGTIDIGGLITGTVVSSGHLEIKDNNLFFAPERFAIDGVGIRGLNASVLKEIPVYNFAKFPIPVTANRVVVSDGTIHIYLEPKK